MSCSILSRYLDPEILGAICGIGFRPKDLVAGNLAGAHQSPRAGFAVEFAGHRPYIPGDDPKYIDWRLFYSRDKYFVKQYVQETNLVCHLVLDVSASMRFGDDEEQKLRYASRMLTALGYAILRQSDSVSLSTFDDEIRGYVPASNSISQIIRFTDQLDNIHAQRKTDMPRCLMELANRFSTRQIVIVLSDFFVNADRLELALQRLRFDKHEVVLLQIVHRQEREFDLHGQVQFIGLEDLRRSNLRPEEVRDVYLDALRRFESRLDQICLENKIERVVAETDRDIADVLIEYMNQR